MDVIHDHELRQINIGIAHYVYRAHGVSFWWLVWQCCHLIFEN